jgi:hypothetical protein
MDVRRDSLILPNRKNPNLTVKRVFLPGAELGLTGELLLWAKEQGIADDEPLFFSRKRKPDGSRRPLQRGQAWLVVSKPQTERRFACLRSAPRSMVGLASQRLCIRICSDMLAYARSCARPRAYRSPRDRQAGRACSRLTSASVTRRHGR